MQIMALIVSNRQSGIPAFEVLVKFTVRVKRTPQFFMLSILATLPARDLATICEKTPKEVEIRFEIAVTNLHLNFLEMSLCQRTI
jgi:hypothetical protein